MFTKVQIPIHLETNVCLKKTFPVIIIHEGAGNGVYPDTVLHSTLYTLSHLLSLSLFPYIHIHWSIFLCPHRVCACFSILTGSERYYAGLMSHYGPTPITILNLLRCDPNESETNLSFHFQESLKHVKKLMDIDYHFINFDWHGYMKVGEDPFLRFRDICRCIWRDRCMDFVDVHGGIDVWTNRQSEREIDMEILLHVAPLEIDLCHTEIETE